MTERIIEFLDDLVATVGAVDKRYCLVEKRQKNETDIPYKYEGNGNYRPVEIDGGSFSYWRITSDVSFDVVEGNTAIKNLSASYPLRFVAMVRRDDVNPLVLSQDIANVLEGRNKDLMTQLQAINVNVTVGSVNTQSRDIWSDEFTVGQELAFDRSMIAIELTVDVVAKRECWQDCDNYPDILQGFNWCGETAATLDRLTQAQKDCISDELCGVCADATVQLNGSTIGTVESGATGDFDVLQDGSPVGSWNGSAFIIPPCAGGGSLEVTVSDNSPNFGDTITITATSSGITPTNYLFFTYDGTTITKIVEQSSNIYDWTVDVSGTYDIYVLATDGTNNTYGKIEITASSPYLLDLISDTPELAFSLRRLKTTSTVAANVRRSSDNTSTDIGFIGEDLDTAALSSFVGVGNGFQAIFYNQGSGGNAIQSTALDQPKMVVSGSVVLLNGKPSVRFESSDKTDFTQVTSSHVFSVVKANSITSSGGQYIIGGNNQGFGIAGTLVTGFFIFDNPTLIQSSIEDTDPHQVTYKCGLSSSALIRVDGSIQATGSISPLTVSRIASRTNINDNNDMNLSELISFSSNISSADESTIESNQKSYYGTP